MTFLRSLIVFALFLVASCQSGPQTTNQSTVNNQAQILIMFYGKTDTSSKMASDIERVVKWDTMKTGAWRFTDSTNYSNDISAIKLGIDSGNGELSNSLAQNFQQKTGVAVLLIGNVKDDGTNAQIEYRLWEKGTAGIKSGERLFMRSAACCMRVGDIISDHVCKAQLNKDCQFDATESYRSVGK